MMNAAYVSTQIVATNTWFLPDAGTSYIPVLSEIAQEPPCDFGYQVELWYEPVAGDGLYGVPPGVNINTETGVIYIEKCMDPSSDPTCS